MTLRGFRPGKQSAEKLHGVEQSITSKSVIGAKENKQQALDLSKYRAMIDIIATTPQYAIILGKKIDSAEIDHLARALLNICNYKCTTCYLIFHLLADEFSTNQENTILRGNSLTTKLETTFCRMVGQEYLKVLFSDIILRLVSDCDLNLATTIFKISNMQGAVAETRVEENRQRVLDVAQEIVDRFTTQEMVDCMPIAIRAIAAYTAYHAQQKYPDRIASYISGFLILRVFNPAIITPESLSMLPEDLSPDPQDRQNFIAITRLLQKLSNQVVLDVRSEDDWINPFMQRNMNKINDYLMKICHDEKCVTDKIPYGKLLDPVYFREQSICGDQFLNPKYILFLHRIIFENGSQILRELTKYPPVMRDGVEVRLDAEFIQMVMLLKQPANMNITCPVSLRDFKQSEEFIWIPARQTIMEQEIEPRFGQTAVSVKNLVYFFGGSVANGTTVTGKSTFLAHNLQTLDWTFLGTDDAPTRKYHAAVATKDGMFIFGGMYQQQCLNDMYFYHFKLQTWSKIEYENKAPTPRYGHSMNFNDGILYVFGGYTFFNQKYLYTDELYLFNLQTRLWSKGESTDSPSERMHHSSVVYNGSLWVFGGRTPDLTGLSDLHRYDISKKTWKQVECRGTPPSERWAHSMTFSSDKKMLVFGGNFDIEYYSDVFEFSFDTQTWREVKLQKVFDKVEGISFHSAVCYQGRLHIFFGGMYALTGTLSDTQHQLSYDIFNESTDKLANDWKLMVNCEEMSDVYFIVENRIVFAHQLVLYARCPILYDLVICSESNELEISDISYKMFIQIILYIYADEIPTFSKLEEALEIILWSRRFDLSDLICKLEKKLVHMVNEKTLSTLLLTAEEYNMKQLEIVCILYLLENEYLTEDFQFHLHSPLVLYSIACRIFPPKTNTIVQSLSPPTNQKHQLE